MSYFPAYGAYRTRGLRFCLAIGLLFGVLAGVLGIVQTLFAAATWAQSVAAEAARFPPGYTGYRDGTNLYRGFELYWLGTSVVSWFAGLVLYGVAASIATGACQRRLVGVLAALLAGITGWAVYLIVNQGVLMPLFDLPHYAVVDTGFSFSSSFNVGQVLLSLGGALFCCALAGYIGALSLPSRRLQ